MTLRDVVYLMAMFGFPVGIGVGYTIKSHFPTTPTDEQLYQFMGRIVNLEELEEHQRILKYKMARNGRKTMRTDSGPNAKVMRMRVRPVARRFRKP